MDREGIIRMGIVGVGNNAGTHHVPAYRLVPNISLLACCATSPERAKAGSRRLKIPAAYTDVATMVRTERLDAVSVCSTNDAHHRNVVDALQAGAHVLCEKPMALDRHQAQDMCEVARRSGRRTMVAFTYRFVPAAQMARELIAGGELGDIFAFQATYVSAYLSDLSRPVQSVWKLRGQSGGGVLRDLGSHLIYLTRWWLGEFARVAGTMHTIRPERNLPGGSRLQVTVDDACTFWAELASGAAGTFFVTKYATGRRNLQRIEVYGSKGGLVYNGESPGVLHVYRGSGFPPRGSWTSRRVPGRFGKAGRIGSVEAHRLAQAQAFVDGILQRRPLEPSFEDGLACQRILDAVAEAAARPGWVTLDG